MAGHRIHIFGASGTGTTTVGRALANALATQHFETDDFYWMPTDPPFRVKRPIPERRALMETVFLPRRDWVLSGSIHSWSEGIAQRFTLAVYLELDTDTRLSRLRRRERWRLALADGGADGEQEEVDAFLEWAAGFEDGLLPGRSRTGLDSWADELDCPLIRLGSQGPVDAMVAQIMAALDHEKRLD
ncbi:hypothetical protein [Tropicimonas sp. IMCC34043]|uniref:hypothetical protein n=1 Tax=Tropicimonas sp. IMCC34043 TaxID=2248760 RepID=UPI000E2501FE|nr:hypothetical protein [Tropicimonas sp. IMCC34043]